MQTNILFPFAYNSKQEIHEITNYTKFGYIKNGQEFIDTGLGNCGSFMLGFDRTDIVDAVTEKCRELPFTSGEFFTTNKYILELSDKLANMTNGFASFYSVSGSDAIEGAIKAAALYHKSNGNFNKKKIIGITESYHGSTYLTSSIAGGSLMTSITGGSDLCIQVKQSDDPDELLANIHHVIFNTGASNISCIVIESCSWLGGLIEYPLSFWTELKEKCNKYDILLIIDDIAMCGGKTGKMFGFDFDIEPDIFTMGKSFSGGYFPLSATLISPKVTSVIKEEFWSHGFTNSFNVSGIYSALEYLKILEEEKIFDNYDEILNTATLAFNKLVDNDIIQSYTNYGLYFNLVFKPLSNYKNVENHFFKHGLNVGIDNYDWKGLRVIIPLTADDEYFNSLTTKLSDALRLLS